MSKHFKESPSPEELISFTIPVLIQKNIENYTN